MVLPVAGMEPGVGAKAAPNIAQPATANSRCSYLASAIGSA